MDAIVYLKDSIWWLMQHRSDSMQVVVNACSSKATSSHACIGDHYQGDSHGEEGALNMDAISDINVYESTCTLYT